MPERPPSTFSQAITAIVTACLPQKLYRLHTEDGQPLTAGPSQHAKRLGMTFKPGQQVLVRRATLDPGRGIILGPSDSKPRA